MFSRITRKKGTLIHRRAFCVTWFSFASAFAACSWAGSPINPDTQKPLELRNGRGELLQVLRAEHFLICADADARLVRRLTRRLESTYADVMRFCEVNAISPRPPEGLLDVIFFEYPEDYHRYAAAVNYDSQGTLGFFHAGTNRTAFFNSENDPRLAEVREQITDARDKLDRRKVAQLEGLLRQYESQINQMVVQHEAAHMVLYNVGVHNAGGSNPPWLVEGLAMLFEPVPTDRGAGFRATNEFRLFDFREALRDGRSRRNLTPKDFLRTVDKGIMVDLPTLVSDPQIWKTDGPAANNYYAEAWALAHYLQRKRPKPWAAYLKTLAARNPRYAATASEDLRAFEEAFGPLDGGFTRRWADHVLRLPAPRVLAKIR